MNWIKLDTCKKDPPFGTKLLIWVDEGPYRGWQENELKEIIASGLGKAYIFNDQDGKRIFGVTHYCIPTEPKK